MIDYNVNINGLDIEAGYNEQDVAEIFVPLLKQLSELQKKKGRRILVMLAAPPGAGKSTLLSFLEKLSKETEGVEEIQTDSSHQNIPIQRDLFEPLDTDS